VSIRFAAGAADRIRLTISGWNLHPRTLAQEVFAELEKLDQKDFRRRTDEKRVFGGAFIHQFRIELLPIVLRAPVAYDARGEEVTIPDFRSGFVTEEPHAP